MGRGKKYQPEQVVDLLRQIEVALSNGKTTPQACKEGGIVEQTYFRWRKEYGESTAFRISAARAGKEAGAFNCPDAAMAGLIEAIVDRVAEILEGIGDELDQLSSQLFTQNEEISHGIANSDLNSVLKAIGRNGDVASRTRECLHSVSRIMPALEREQALRPCEEIAKRLITVHQDVKSLLDHAAFLSGKVQLLLDSALGTW